MKSKLDAYFIESLRNYKTKLEFRNTNKYITNEDKLTECSSIKNEDCKSSIYFDLSSDFSPKQVANTSDYSIYYKVSL